MGKKDALIKRYFSNDERFADLWNGYCGKTILSPGKLKNLEPHGIRKIDQEGVVKEIEHDLLRQSWEPGRYGVYGIEHQENVDYRMVIRSISYTLDAYERQMRTLQKVHKEKKDLTSEVYLSGISKTDRLYPAAILIIYFGKKPWDGAMDLYGMLGMSEEQEEYKELFSNFRMNLLDVQRFEHNERFCTDIRLVFGFLQRRGDKNALRKFIRENEESFACMDEETYDVIQAYGNIRYLKEVKEKFRNKGGINMGEAWNEIMKEERMIGKKAGERIGEERGEKRGEKRGEERLARLISVLLEKNLMRELEIVLRNKSYRGKMYKKYGIS